MTMSVIICAYTMDRWEALSEAVASVFRQTRRPEEVIVVIDYNEELLERATREFRGARVIANELTKGLSGARNTGVRAATGDILVFLDDDAYGEDEWLENLLAPFDDPSVAGCGGWIVPHWESGEPRWFPRTFWWVMGCSYDGLPPDGSRIRNPIGANMAIRREVFVRAGGFSAGLGRIGTTPLGCEETELCIRYGEREPADSFVLVRSAVVHHRVPASRCTWRYFFRRCWSEGLSKAAVASLVGHDAGLSAERRHVAVAIPREMMSSCRELWRQPGVLAQRLFAVASGSLLAAAGLLRGTLAVKKNPISLQSAFLEGVSEPGEDLAPWRPVAMVQVDVDEAVRGRSLPADVNDRVWVEFLREGQVVGREEMRAAHATLGEADIAAAVARHRDQVSTFVSMPDELLPSISIVVPTICRFPDELRRFAEGLATLDYPDFEVILVDNRVAPTYEMPRFDGFERVRVVSERIPGISAARNRGVREARGDVVAFTDDDVVVDARWLRAIGGRMAANPEISVVGGLVLPAELATEPQLWFEEYFGGFSQSFDLRIARLDHHPDDSLFPYAAGRYAAGCNMAYRRSALEELGGFLVSLGTGTPARGGEDLEAVVSLASRGAVIAFEPAALVRHIHRATEEDFLKQAQGYGAGLTAMFTSLVLRDPAHLVKMSRRAWEASRSLAGRGERSFSATATYPAATRRIERRGMLYGPVAYLKSRRMFSRRREELREAFGDHVRY